MFLLHAAAALARTCYLCHPHFPGSPAPLLFPQQPVWGQLRSIPSPPRSWVPLEAEPHAIAIFSPSPSSWTTQSSPPHPLRKKRKEKKPGTLFPKRLLALRKYRPDVFGNKAFGLPGIQRAPWELAAHDLQQGPLGASSPLQQAASRLQFLKRAP